MVRITEKRGRNNNENTNKSRTVELLAKFMKIDMKTNADAIEEAYNFIRIGTDHTAT